MPPIASGRAKHCTKSDPCGESCIPRGNQCHVDLPPDVQADIASLRRALGATFGESSSIPGVATAVKTGREVKKLGKIRSLLTSGLPKLQKAMAVGAVIAAVGVKVYAAGKERHQKNIVKNASLAKTMGNGWVTEDIDKGQITFTVDEMDFTGSPERGTLRTGLMQDEEFAAEHHVIESRDRRFNDVTPLPSDVKGVARVAASLLEQSKRVIDSTLVRGGNPQALQLAAQVHAYADKYPGKPINFVGKDAGGLVVQEAVDLVSAANPALGKKLRSITIGTPDVGLFDGNDDSISLASRKNPLSLVPMKKKLVVDADDTQGAGKFLQDPEVKATVRGHFVDPQKAKRQFQVEVAQAPKSVKSAVSRGMSLDKQTLRQVNAATPTVDAKNYFNDQLSRISGNQFVNKGHIQQALRATEAQGFGPAKPKLSNEAIMAKVPKSTFSSTSTPSSTSRPTPPARLSPPPRPVTTPRPSPNATAPRPAAPKPLEPSDAATMAYVAAGGDSKKAFSTLQEKFPDRSSGDIAKSVNISKLPSSLLGEIEDGYTNVDVDTLSKLGSRIKADDPEETARFAEVLRQVRTEEAGFGNDPNDVEVDSAILWKAMGIFQTTY